MDLTVEEVRTETDRIARQLSINRNTGVDDAEETIYSNGMILRYFMEDGTYLVISVSNI